MRTTAWFDNFVRNKVGHPKDGREATTARDGGSIQPRSNICLFQYNQHQMNRSQHSLSVALPVTSLTMFKFSVLVLVLLH